MSESQKYIITYDQLMGLITEKDLPKRMALIVAVTSTPYREKSASEAVITSAKNLIDSL